MYRTPFTVNISEPIVIKASTENTAHIATPIVASPRPVSRLILLSLYDEHVILARIVSLFKTMRIDIADTNTIHIRTYAR